MKLDISFQRKVSYNRIIARGRSSNTSLSRIGSQTEVSDSVQTAPEAFSEHRPSDGELTHIHWAAVERTVVDAAPRPGHMHYSQAAPAEACLRIDPVDLVVVKLPFHRSMEVDLTFVGSHLALPEHHMKMYAVAEGRRRVAASAGRSVRTAVRPSMVHQALDWLLEHPRMVSLVQSLVRSDRNCLAGRRILAGLELVVRTEEPDPDTCRSSPSAWANFHTLSQISTHMLCGGAPDCGC